MHLQRARWFKFEIDPKNKIYRYELVYVYDYVDYNGESKKYVDVRRMNHEQWKEPLRLSKGFKKLQDYTKSTRPPKISYSSADIEWFLHWGMDSFLKYHTQVNRL